MQTHSEAMTSARGAYGTPWKEWLAALAASITLLLTSSDIVWIDWSIEVLSIANTFLIITGAIVGVVSADTFGRKITLLVTLLFVIPRLLSWHIAVMESSLVTKCLMFFGSGVSCTVVPLYISEIAGPSNRDILMVLPMAMYFLEFFGLQIAASVFQSIHVYHWLAIIKSIVLIVSVFFSGTVLGMFPETPQYLYWTARPEEATRSQAFFRGIHHGETIKTTLESLPVNALTTTQANKASEQEGCGRAREIIKFENRRSLAMIFILIAVKWASGLRRNLIVVTAITNNFNRSYNNYTIICVTALELIFSICVMLMINFFQRKMCLCFVIFMNFVAVVIGLTPIAQIYWVIYGSILIQVLGQMVLLAVTLSYVGIFFPTSIRSYASVIAISFEVIVRNVIFKIEECVTVAMFVGYSIPLLYNYITGLILFLALFLVIVFFPKAKRDSYAEIGGQILEGRE